MISMKMNVSKLTAEAKNEKEILDSLQKRFFATKNSEPNQSPLLTTAGQQLALRQFFRDKVDEFTKPVLATLTFKNPPLKDETVRAAFDRFIERLSKRCFRNAYRRYKKRIVQPAAVWEQNASTRLNIHAVFECPEKIDVEDFKRLISSAWACGTVEFQDSYIHPERGLSDWIDYMCKYRSKDLFERSFLDYWLI